MPLISESGSHTLQSQPLVVDCISRWNALDQFIVASSGQIFLLQPIAAPKYSDDVISAFVSTDIDADLAKRPRFRYDQGAKPLNDPDMRYAETCPEMFLSADASPADVIPSVNGCLIATVTTGQGVEIFAPQHHPITGSYKQLVDLSTKLYEYLGFTHDAVMKDRSKLDALESTSLAWSPPCRTARNTYYSTFLAVGNKDGSVVIWQWVKGNLEICANVKVHESWLNRIAWSFWNDGPDTAQYAMIITGSAEGDIKASLLSYVPNEEAKFTLLSTIELVKADDRAVNCVRVYSDEDERPRKVAIGKGTHLYVWMVPDVFTNAFAPGFIPDMAMLKVKHEAEIAAVSWSVDGTKLNLYHQSGSAYEIAVSTHLSLSNELTATLQKKLLAQAVPLTEDDDDDDDEPAANDGVNGAASTGAERFARFCGAAPTVCALYDSLVYLLLSKSYIQYVIPKNAIAFAALVKRETNANVIENVIGKRIRSFVQASNFLKSSPQAALSDAILYCVHEAMTEPDFNAVSVESNREHYYYDRLINLLRDLYVSSPAATVPDGTPDDVALRIVLYGDSRINALRVMSSLIFGGRNIPVLDAEEQEKIYEENCMTLYRHYIDVASRLILKWLQSETCIDAASACFIIRICGQILSNPNSFPDMTNRVTTILAALIGKTSNAINSALNLPTTIEGVDTVVRGSSSLNMSEPCPGCEVLVPIENPFGSRCSKGHIFDRCAISLQLVATPDIRRCLGCSRIMVINARQRISSFAGMNGYREEMTSTAPSGTPSFLQRWLDACTICPYCGNRWYRVDGGLLP
ncbi:hypothetical protein SeMB42_g02081 [Synchytrium endobioticum]|uniref:Uncharacterized protein n=1 Tax=Synchytrium endobioticum TaxID=286115 RepID=A0A507DH84_9FUNG|nr:hypothetical protein SeLEV6574_g05552 [Synchytrium endobioticum]TPX50944.1 hypothetical protein SeMB42_g02081 [Synchytrium endobioticum]